MMQKGLVSAITPVYNGEKYIARLLDSVLAQDYPRIEMILSDDGSTDGTVDTANKYADKFEARGYSLKIITSPHKNASAAINSALPSLSGEYLIWPDADDELMPGSVSKRVGFLEKNAEYNGVRSLMEYVSQETGELLNEQENLGDLSEDELFWDILEARTFVCAGCYMLKTEEFFKIYPEKKIPEYEVGQNFQMLLPFTYKNKCATIAQKLYRVYVRSGGHSRQTRTEAEEEARCRSFELLADNIFNICGIEENKAAQAKLRSWKASRRASLARRYKHIGRFVKYKTAAVFSEVNYLFCSDKDKREIARKR